MPLNINGMQGRMVRMPPLKNESRELLFVYGHHSSLERWWGVTQNLNRYGGVTMPDLPGFGGMDSLYKIGKSATIDNLADYLAAFIKLRFKRKRIVIVGMSFGFVIATRMLQRYPELIKKVELLVSFAGFAHHDDFTFSPARMRFYRVGTRLFELPIPATFFRYAILNSLVLRTFYSRTHNAKEKFKDVSQAEKDAMTDFEIRLWQDNDVRTYMKTTIEFLHLDNCQKRINMPVYHLAVKADHFFSNELVEQHMRVIFSDFKILATLNSGSHAPSLIADAKAAAPFVPSKLRTILSHLDSLSASNPNNNQ